MHVFFTEFGIELVKALRRCLGRNCENQLALKLLLLCCYCARV
jgi:hypothetical protein